MASTVEATAAVGTGGSAAMSSVARSGSTFAAAMITGGKRPSPEVCHTLRLVNVKGFTMPLL